MADHLFTDDTRDVEGKFIGWDYSHYGDYLGYDRYYGCDKDEKKWTTQEIFEEVKEACFQLKFLEDDEEEKEAKETFKCRQRETYKKWIKEDIYRMLLSFGLAFISTLLFFFTDLIFYKVLNLFNIILALIVFIQNTKSFIEELDELASID